MSALSGDVKEMPSVCDKQLAGFEAFASTDGKTIFNWSISTTQDNSHKSLNLSNGYFSDESFHRVIGHFFRLVKVFLVINFL